MVKRNNQHERYKVRRPCVRYLRAQLAMNQLKRYPIILWRCDPDLGNLKPHVAKQYWLDGYDKGNFDMEIKAANKTELKNWLIEFKYGYNGYTDKQKEVVKLCEDTPIQTVKIKSIDEFIEFIENNLR